jgi:hypothetical protein
VDGLLNDTEQSGEDEENAIELDAAATRPETMPAEANTSTSWSRNHRTHAHAHVTYQTQTEGSSGITDTTSLLPWRRLTNEKRTKNEYKEGCLQRGRA